MIRSLGTVLALLLVTCPLAAAAEPALQAAPPPKQLTEAEKKQAEADRKKLAELRKQIEVKKKDLNGTQWEVVYSSHEDANMKGQKDTFVFQDSVFRSKSFEKRGFPVTNYTITIPGEGSEGGTWETMTTSQDGVAFIRGDWHKNSMGGSITEQSEKGKKSKTYYFTASSRTGIPPTSAKEEVKVGEEETALETTPEGPVSAALVSKETPKQSSKNPDKKPSLVAMFKPGTTEETGS